MSGAVRSFEIVLEHDIDEQHQFEPGELITGKVVLNTEQTIRVKAVQIQVRGEAAVSWQKEDTSGETFSTNDVYVDKTYFIFGGDKGDVQSTEVSKGEHSYHFEFRLPEGIPSSFIGKFGNVTYIIKATLKEDRPGELGTTITTEPFLVMRPLDLSSRPELRDQRSVVASRRTSGFSLFCCLFGKTVGRFGVNRTGFLPGDEMTVEAEVTNGGSQAVKAIQVALVLVCTFRAKRMVRTHTQVVLRKSDSVEIGYEENRKWSGIRLSVPAFLPESRLEGCDMIVITYELRFRLEMADGSDVTASIPVTIGTPKRRNNNNNNVGGSKGSVRRTGSYNRSVRSSKGMMGNREENGGAGGGGGGEDAETEMEKFRHPMIPGETRKNVLYDGGD